MAGAGGAGEASMDDINGPWNKGAPGPAMAPPVDRTDQLMQQMARLRDENR